MPKSPLKKRSTRSQEPSWFDQKRGEFWEQFQSIPNPDAKDENWRFSSAKMLDFDSYQPAEAIKSKKKREEIIQKSSAEFEIAGNAVFANDQLLHFQKISAELEKKGVVWKPIEQAAIENEELFKQHFPKSVSSGSNKFAALHMAHLRAGMFLYVPAGIKIELPVAAFYWLDGKNSSIFPHTLLIAEEESSVALVDFFRSGASVHQFACGMSSLHVGPRAKVKYIAVHEWGNETLSLFINSARVEREAEVKNFLFNTGGKFSRSENASILAGAEARAEMFSISIGNEQQQFDQRTLQQHIAPNTWSNLLYKNVLSDHAKSVFQGMIRVEPNARQTDAYQTNRNLLLSPDVEADSLPGLEILNDDVRCSHGAATSQLDEEQLFYLQARGIRPPAAQKLLSIGFVEEILARLENEEISKTLKNSIESRF